MFTFAPRLAAAVLSFSVGVASHQAYLFCLSYLNDKDVSAEELMGRRPDDVAPVEKVPGCGDPRLRATQATLERVEASVGKKEPGWGYIKGFCTCGGLFPDDRKIVEGSWQRKTDAGPPEVRVEIHEAGSCEGLARWLGRLSRGGEWENWKGRKYDLGDEAYLSPPSEKNPNYDLYVRVNNLLVVVRGKSLPDVERFARYVIAELPAG